MKKLKEIVEVLSQIVPLVCGGQDGGPGSGVKGHTTANKPDPNNLNRNDYDFGSPEWLSHAKKIQSAQEKTNPPRNENQKRQEEESEYKSPGKKLYEKGLASGKYKHNNTPETLYKEGMGAARSRAKQADSPYEKGSPEHKHWLIGYKSYGSGGK